MIGKRYTFIKYYLKKIPRNRFHEFFTWTFLKSNIFQNRPKFYYAGCCCNEGSIILKYRYVYGSWDLCYIQNVSCSINILSRLFIHTRPASTNIVFSACNKIYQHPMAMPPPLQIKTTSNSGNC